MTLIAQLEKQASKTGEPLKKAARVAVTLALLVIILCSLWTQMSFLRKWMRVQSKPLQVAPGGTKLGILICLPLSYL